MSDALREELERVAGVLGAPGVPFVLERPRGEGHGDLATNLAMVLAGPLRSKPRVLAERVLQEMKVTQALVTRTEIAGPGFINFWLSSDHLSNTIQEILTEGSAYGRSTIGLGQRVNVEFVSANPTGPLHVGHGRGAALGDGLASLLEWTGHDVTREFYINDAGVQIGRVVESLWARMRQAQGEDCPIPEGGYHGEYLIEAAERALTELPPASFAPPFDSAAPALREFVLRVQREEQDALLLDFGVRFDVYGSESAMYQADRVATLLKEFENRRLTFEADGALWLRTTDFGDDKDRVLRKSDGTYTYLMPDIVYHADKHDRGFDRAIDVWGADHHGYIPRMRAALAALGYPPEFFEVAMIQLVKVMKDGEEVRMSKRAGDFVTLRDLCDWVGADAARYFFLMRRGDTPFVFDVDLARARTEENPVFYVQMAHARMSGIFRVAHIDPETVNGTFDVAALTAPEDIDLIKTLALFPGFVERAALGREPHRVTGYLEDLARQVHGWYHRCRVLGEPAPTEHARLVLARATRTVLANGLTLLGLSAPDRM